MTVTLWGFCAVGFVICGLAVALNLAWMFLAGVGVMVSVVAVRLVIRLRRVSFERLVYRRERDRRTLVPVQSISSVDPIDVGIAPAAPAGFAGQALSSYLPRDVDEQFHTAIREALEGSGSWIVVATGSSKVGKSRTLFEALRYVAGYEDIEFVAPVDSEALLLLLAERSVGEAAGRRRALWLDDLEPFLSQGVTWQMLREWHAGVAEGVVAATYGGKGSDLVRGSASTALVTIAADVLEHAREIQVQGTMPHELKPLRAELSPEAFSSIEEHGLGAYLVAAPALVRKLTTARHAPGELECPEGVAVVYAAIDWVRCGRSDPIPEATLRDLWRSYLRAEVRATDGGFQTGLEWARRGVAGTIALLLSQGDGYRPYDYLVQFVDDAMPSMPPHEATWARAIEDATDAQALDVGTKAYLHGSYRTALTAFQVAGSSPTAEVAAVASFNVGVTLAELNRPEEAIAVYDEVVKDYGDDPALREQAAAAMVNKGVALAGLRRLHEAAAVYDQVLERFDGASELGLREQVAKALVGWGMTLGELKEPELATTAFDRVLHRFDDAPEPVLREQVALALVSKGITLVELDRPDDAIAVYDEVVARYSDAPELPLLRLVAEALGSKGVALAAMGRQEDAITTYAEVVRLCEGASDLELRRLAARASYSVGLTLTTLGREQEAITVFEEISMRYGEAPDGELRELSERAQSGKSVALGTLKRSEEIRAGDAEVLGRANVGEEERLKADFERNLREPVRVTGLRLTGLHVFTDTSWQLQPSMNILLGRNGYGKSLLLRIMAGMLQRDREVTGDLFEGSDGRIELGLARNGTPEKIERDRSVFLRASLGKVPLLAIPDARFMDRSTTTVSDPENLNPATEGADHFLAQLPYHSAVNTLLGGLSYDYLEHGKTFALPAFSLIEEMLDRFAAQSFEFRNIERVGRTGSRIWVRTEGLDRDIEIQRASQGTLSVITMFGLIHNLLQELADTRGVSGGDEVRRQEAIVLIDEVDAHLHPAWQQKIRNTLVEFFPNVQFLLSAHSPLVVAGSGPGEVSVLRREEEGYEVEQLRQDFVGASVTDLYGEIFDIEDLDENFLKYAGQKATGRATEIDRQLEELLDNRGDEDLSEQDERLRQQLVLDRDRIERVDEVNEQREDVEMQLVEKDSEILRLERALEQSKADDGRSK
jgi:tetratricopeptide (TPR) repeat protein/energy-coupling factor transporter ATP-binding protein EcfA2